MEAKAKRYVRFMSFEEFERLSDEPMRKSQGRYRDQEADEDIFNPLAPIPMMKVDEYSVESYSREDMRLVRLGEVISPIERKINWWKRV